MAVRADCRLAPRDPLRRAGGHDRSRAALARAAGRRHGGARLPARPLPQRGLRDVGQLLVLRPPRLRHLLVALLPARVARGDQAARGAVARRRRRGGHAPRSVDAGRAHVRSRVGPVRPLRRVPLHARRRVRAARARLAALVGIRTAGRARLGGQPAGSAASGGRARRGTPVAPVGVRPRIDRVPDRARAPLSRPRPLSVSVGRVDRGPRVRRRRDDRRPQPAGAPVLRGLSCVRAARVCVPVATRRERSPVAVHGDTAVTARGARAAVVGRRPPRRAMRFVQPVAARVELRQGNRRACGHTRVLGSRDRVPARTPRSELPRERARHRDSLGGGLRARGGLPDHARLVPPGRLPRERDPVFGRAECQEVRALVTRAGRPLRAGSGRPARPQLEARGTHRGQVALCHKARRRLDLRDAPARTDCPGRGDPPPGARERHAACRAPAATRSRSAGTRRSTRRAPGRTRSTSPSPAGSVASRAGLRRRCATTRTCGAAGPPGRLR